MNAARIPVGCQSRAPGEARRALGTAIIICAAVCVLPVGPGAGASTASPVSPQTDAQVLAGFEKRVAEYCALHKKVEDNIPGLPVQATAQQVDKALHDLRSGIVAARARAQVGDVFTQETRRYLRRQLARAFSGPDREQLRKSILDNDPMVLPIQINGPYPDSVPLSTMPPKVLEALPRLPEPLEFRFVRERLILFDADARLIVDWVDAALPKL